MAQYKFNLDFGNFQKGKVDWQSIVNLDTVSLYLRYGLQPPPGSNRFIKGQSTPKFELPDIKRDNQTDYNDVLVVLKKYIYELVQTSKLKGRPIVLMLTSGLDSRLLYNLILNEVIKNSSVNDFHTVTGNVSGYDNKYSEVEKITENWSRKPVNHSIIDVLFSVDSFESDIKHCNLINNGPINGLVSVVLEKVYCYISKTWENPLVVSGLGDSVFFATGGGDFIKDKHSNKEKIDLKIYSADSLVMSESSYLDSKWNKTSSDQLNNTKEHKVFDCNNSYERYIHRQQFFSNGPKVLWENFSYANYYKLELLCPFMGTDLLESILNLPTNLLYDGRSKTTVMALLEKCEGREPKRGITMTSPQRELLIEYFENEISNFFEESILIDIGIVDRKLIVKEVELYLDEYYSFHLKSKSDQFNSFSIWKFLSTELWFKSISGVA
jgi:hypothetical protein